MLSRLSGRAPRALQSLLTAPALRASSRQANAQLFSRFAGRSQGQQRSFSSGASSSAAPHSSGSSSSFNLGVWGALGALVGTSLYYVYNEEDQTAHAAAGPVDYEKVRADIAELLDDNNYDDGSYGPVFVRLAWHASGTYDAKTGTGGSNGSTMRFDPESKWGANSGLAIARDRLEGVKKKHPNITYADLWTLAGAVAIEEMGGPKIAWRPGREDHVDGKKIVEDGRLPDATQGQDHLRKIFYRMGFNDQEIVALSGAHSLGRCHTDRSGFEGPWSRAPTTVSNEYFRLLLEEKWQVRDWKGPKQFENASDRTLMMLTSDLALIQDPAFRKWVELYAKDEDAWRRDFAAAFSRLMELGVPFK